MSKEIEKWKREDYDKMSKETLIQIMVDKDDYFEELTTPPTEQEVCKELSECLEQDVKYISGMFYYGEDLQFTEICNTTIEDLNGNQLYNIYLHLPPHLITLIGRFYEGKAKE